MKLKKKKVSSDSVFIEATSGNTGIALAFICAARGYNLILTMPSSMSIERRKNAKLSRRKNYFNTQRIRDEWSNRRSKKNSQKTKNSIILNQFKNNANPDIHFKTTAHEIWNDTQGKIDFFISGVGTGGTISGVGKYLKEKNKDVKIIAVEPEDSAVISGGEPGSHSIQGIGAGFIPKNLNLDVIDQVLPISNTSAFQFSKILGRYEGIAGGISSGSFSSCSRDT